MFKIIWQRHERHSGILLDIIYQYVDEIYDPIFTSSYMNFQQQFGAESFVRCTEAKLKGKTEAESLLALHIPHFHIYQAKIAWRESIFAWRYTNARWENTLVLIT